MRGFVILSMILAVLFGWLVIDCSDADADATSQQQFLDAVHAAGFDQPDDLALRDGYWICSVTQARLSDDLIGRGIQEAQRFLNHDVTPDLDRQMIVLSKQYLCPPVGK